MADETTEEKLAEKPEAKAAERRQPGRTVASRRLALTLIAGLLAVLGLAIVAQVNTRNTDEDLQGARQEDLVRILGDLDSRQERLRSELAALEDSKRQLTSGAQGKEAALAAARSRADELGILAGTLPATGTGLEIEFRAGTQPVTASTVLDAVEELRGAGAEAMQIGGATGGTVRIVAQTYFVDDGAGIIVDGVKLGAPFTVSVIGDPQTMRAALNIPGGVVDMVRRVDGTVVIRQPGEVRVTSLRQAVSAKYARPVS